MRRTRFAAAVIVVTALIGGCAYDWSFPGGVDPSLDSGKDTAGETSTADGSRDQETFDSLFPPPLPEGGCDPKTPCPGAQYCRYADSLCGEGVNIGTCLSPEKAGSCSQSREVCACNNAVYPDSCQATGKQQDVSSKAPCATPANFFRCESTFCKTGAEFCVTSKGKYPQCVSYATCTPPNTTCGTCVDPKDSYPTCTCNDVGKDIRVDCP